MTTQAPVSSVVIADDHPLVLRGLSELISDVTDFTIVGVSADGPSALSEIERSRPTLALLDLSMPGMSGLDVLRNVARSANPVRVIFLAASVTADQVLDAIAAGVHGILLKEAAPEALIECMRTVVAGRRWLPPGMVEWAIADQTAVAETRSLLDRLLTVREREIVNLVCIGLSNKAIARELTVSEGTVKIHLHNIFRKLDISNRASLVRIASHAER